MIIKNKKGDTLHIFLIVAVFLGLILLLLVAIGGGNEPPDDPPPEGVDPSYEIVNPNNCKNREDTFGWGKVKCAITIRNMESHIPIQLEPTFKCWKLSESYSPKYIPSQRKAIASGGSEEFSVKFDNDGREWSCEISNVNPTPIQNRT